MSKMNFEDWPVVDMSDFEQVVADVTRFDSGEYVAIFNFYHTVAEKEGERNTGYSLCTRVHGKTLRELYVKITNLIGLGIFDGSNVQAHGTLYDENHDEIADICWHQYSDEAYDDETDDDFAGLVIDGGSQLLRAPAMLQ